MSSRESTSIQMLRALAALMVLGLHLGVAFGLGPMESLNRGVELFFFISGFVMYISTVSRPGGAAAAGQFFRRRFMRIVPIYWIFLSAYIVEVYPGLRGGVTLPDAGAVAGAFLLWLPRTGWPLLTVSWTLTFELFFYFSLGLAIVARRSVLWVAPPLVIMGLCAVIGYVPHSPLGVLFNYRLLDFVGGLGIGWLTKSGYILPKSIAWSTVAIFIALVLLQRAPASPPAYWTLTICCGLLLMAGLRLERQIPIDRLSSVILVGDASYALYLSHLLVLHVVVAALRGHPRPYPVRLLEATLTALLCVLAAIAAHLWLERPILRFAARKPMAARAPVALRPADRTA